MLLSRRERNSAPVDLAHRDQGVLRTTYGAKWLWTGRFLRPNKNHPIPHPSRVPSKRPRTRHTLRTTQDSHDPALALLLHGHVQGSRVYQDLHLSVSPSIRQPASLDHPNYPLVTEKSDHFCLPVFFYRCFHVILTDSEEIAGYAFATLK